MASRLEQTRRNSAILGCLTLSSIFASFSTFLQFAALQAVNNNRIGWLGSRFGLRIESDPGLDRIGSDWYFRF